MGPGALGPLNGFGSFGSRADDLLHTTVWGHGDIQTFEGGPSAVSVYDGDLRTAYVEAVGAGRRRRALSLAGGKRWFQAPRKSAA